MRQKNVSVSPFGPLAHKSLTHAVLRVKPQIEPCFYVKIGEGYNYGWYEYRLVLQRLLLSIGLVLHPPTSTHKRKKKKKRKIECIEMKIDPDQNTFIYEFQLFSLSLTSMVLPVFVFGQWQGHTGRKDMPTT